MLVFAAALSWLGFVMTKPIELEHDGNDGAGGEDHHHDDHVTWSCDMVV